MFPTHIPVWEQIKAIAKCIKLFEYYTSGRRCNKCFSQFFGWPFPRRVKHRFYCNAYKEVVKLWKCQQIYINEVRIASVNAVPFKYYYIIFISYMPSCSIWLLRPNKIVTKRTAIFSPKSIYILFYMLQIFNNNLMHDP